MKDLNTKIDKIIEDFEEKEEITTNEDYDHPDLVKIFKLGMEFALNQVIKDYVPDGNPERWLNKIEDLLDKVNHKIKMGDKVTVPINLTRDPSNKQGQTGEVIGLDEEVLVKFEDGIIQAYQTNVFD